MRFSLCQPLALALAISSMAAVADPLSGDQSIASTPITFHLAILTTSAPSEEVEAALALAGSPLDTRMSENLGSAATLRVVPEEDLGQQVKQQLSAGRLQVIGQRSGTVVERRGVVSEVVLQPSRPGEDAISIALAAHATAAIGDRLPSAVRYRASALTPQGRQILYQGQMDPHLSYGDALVVHLRNGPILVAAPGMFDHGPAEDYDEAGDIEQISDERFERLLEEAGEADVIYEQGSGAAIEWYTPYGAPVPDDVESLR